MGQTQGRELPYDVGEQFTCLTSKTIWSVHTGKKQGSGEPVTVFVFDFAYKSPEEIKIAQSAHLRLKTLRHPNILKYIDGIELPTSIYLVTEEAVPLQDSIATKDGSSTFSMTWGVHQALKSLSFLCNDCNLVHHNVCLSSVFVDEAGEWKLAGVEFMHPYSDAPVPRKHLDLLQMYEPPEGSKSTSSKAEKWSIDMWGLGCLVWEVFNGPLPQASSLRNTSKIPKPLLPHYREMVSANPQSRPNPSDLLNRLREHGGFLDNKFVTTALRIEEVQFMEPVQRNDFFNELNKNIDSFPEGFAKHKILPQLINAFEFGGAGSSVLAPLFKLGGLLKGEQYQKKIVPCVVKLFSSTDRATRLNLLQQLQHFIHHLLPATVNDQIYPHIASGFNDTVPALRELTVKAAVLLAPKLSSATLNNQLLKSLAKCQLDEQPSIRTNTNICLGKIAGYLSPSTRQKVLVTAFLRALKDPFPPARIAAIGSLGATHAFYSTSDLSSRILPALCTVVVDKEKEVRDQAFQTIKFFLAKLEKLSEDPQAAAEQEKIEASSTSWTGWAVSSLASKFYKTPRSQATPTSGGAEMKGTSAEATQRNENVKEVGKAESNRARSEHGGKGKSADMEPSTDDASWQDDKWTDCNVEVHGAKNKVWGAGDGGEKEEVEAKDDSDMEGWGDSWGEFDSVIATSGSPSATAYQGGRGDFDSTPQRRSATPPFPPQPQKKEVSSGPAFFDSISGSSDSQRNKPSSRDPFENFGIQSASRKKCTAPLPTSASLFGGGVASEGDKGGWGDWNEEFAAPQKETSKSAKLCQKDNKDQTNDGWGMEDTDWGNFDNTEEPKSDPNKDQVIPSSDGWGADDTNWGSFNDGPKSGAEVASGQSKQDILQKKREERRLKQQAAREKRASGAVLKPSRLGTVKKD